MKKAITLLILCQCTLIIVGVYFLYIGFIGSALFLIIANLVFIGVNLKTIQNIGR